MADEKLNEKQRKFALEYLANGFNATQAAMSAGYSKQTAHQQGSRLLRNVKVEKFITKRKAKTEKVTEVSHQYLVDKLNEILDKSMGDTRYHKNAIRAIELLGKHVGFFKEDNDQKKPEFNMPFIEWTDATSKN